MGAKKLIQFHGRVREKVQNNSNDIRRISEQLLEVKESIKQRIDDKHQQTGEKIQEQNNRLTELEKGISKRFEKQDNRLTELEKGINKQFEKQDSRWMANFKMENERQRKEQKFLLVSAGSVCSLIFAGLFLFMLSLKNDIKGNRQLITSSKESNEKLIRENREQLIRIDEQLKYKTKAKNTTGFERELEDFRDIINKVTNKK